jgi:mRNA-degrading endonuclease RelE of RelBE toxin-antitoxin system
MNPNRILTFQKHHVVLKIIFHIGNGIMLAKQLQEILKFNHPTQFWRVIDELCTENLLKKGQFHQHTHLRLTAAGVRMITGKKVAEEVPFASSRLLKSVMVSELVIRRNHKKSLTPEELLPSLLASTSLCYPHRSPFLLKSIAENFSSLGMDCSGIKQELSRLSAASSPRSDKIRNLAVRNVYIGKQDLTKTGDYRIVVDILDVARTIDANHISERVEETLEILREIFRNELRLSGMRPITYSFVVITQNQEREKAIKKQLNKAELSLQRKHINLLNVTFHTRDLNLTKSIFLGSRIII